MKVTFDFLIRELRAKNYEKCRVKLYMQNANALCLLFCAIMNERYFYKQPGAKSVTHTILKKKNLISHYILFYTNSCITISLNNCTLKVEISCLTSFKMKAQN